MAAGKLASLISGSRMAGKYGGLGDLAKSAAPGAVLSGLFATFTTGNPVAGLTVAAADVLGSTALAAGVGKLGQKKIFGKDVNFAGGPVTRFNPSKVPQAAQKDSKLFRDFLFSRTGFEPSPAQVAAQVTGSIGSVLAVEPLFYPKPQSSIVTQQLNQRLGFDALMSNASANPRTVSESATDPNLPDGLIRRSDTEYPGGGYATGTLYQVGGTPMRGM